MFYRLLIALGLLASLSACNTISGIGKDVGAAGDAITGTAEQTREGLSN